jgi:hypothetical protein
MTFLLKITKTNIFKKTFLTECVANHLLGGTNWVSTIKTFMLEKLALMPRI